MTEKLLIIAEKPSAAKNFNVALGGQSGTFDGNEFAIVNLFGHILQSGVPDEVAKSEYKQRVGKFSQLAGIPWSADWFDFDNKTTKEGDDSGIRVIQDIRRYVESGYIPVIASDVDPSGEGDLLVREVLVHIGYTGKTYREYHLDESKKEIQKSMRNLKVVTEDDPTYRMAFARSNMDYLTQQLTRVATMTIQKDGYKVPAAVPMGRLKSVILTILGDQLLAIKAYRPTSVFESRYKLDKLVLIGEDMPKFKTKEEWQADGLPFESRVKEIKQVRGETIPPKPMTLSQIAGLMAKKGMKSKRFLDTYQKMYEAGIVSYPRTEDNFISPEQFNEMLPNVDTILGLLSLPTAAFTHRAPRPTHVKTGGSHGAIRPGMTLPTSLGAIDDQFGRGASEIYKLAAERFLMMFLENTEWVKHVYQTTDTPKPFVGTIKIITKQGVVDPDENQDDVSDHLPDLSQMAQLYPHELKSKKPHATDASWLGRQLAKADVGTEATRVSTISAMSGNDGKESIIEGRTLDLSVMGWVGYQAAKQTKIGSVEGTRYLGSLVKEVKAGKNIDEAYKEFTDVIAHDVEVLKAMSVDWSAVGLQKGAGKVEASWHGRDIAFKGSYMDHEFSEEEVQMLLNDEPVTVEITLKDGRKAKVKGTLQEQEYKGRPFIGFKGSFVDDNRVSGTWNGREVTIKKTYMDHEFTQQELETLFNGGSVDIETHKDGKTYNLTGKLEEQEYKGRQFVGYKGVFAQQAREGYATGIWQGKEVSFKSKFMDHEFTSGEIQVLLNDGTLSFETHKGDKTYSVSGKLENQEYNGHKYVGFKPEFDSNKTDDPTRASGIWHGNQVSFKKTFMKHEFTPSEIEQLLNGQRITFVGTTNNGSQSSVTGALAEQEFKGRTFVGFKAEFDNKADKGL